MACKARRLAQLAPPGKHPPSQRRTAAFKIKKAETNVSTSHQLASAFWFNKNLALNRYFFHLHDGFDKKRLTYLNAQDSLRNQAASIKYKVNGTR
jgi:hypothetical protein